MLGGGGVAMLGGYEAGLGIVYVCWGLWYVAMLGVVVCSYVGGCSM